MAKMEIDLKPCPFCGSLDIEYEIFDNEDKEGWPTRFVCTGCGTLGPWECISIKEDVCINNPQLLRLWNNRF